MLEVLGLSFGSAPAGSLTGQYNVGLVVLSIVVASMASYTALDLAGQVTHAGKLAGRIWLLGGALAMGAGIWSMHFIGMLAFSLPIRLAYDPSITFLSLVIAVAVSGFALRVVSGKTLVARDLLTGGVIMGLGICAMHYTGMAAMRMFPPIVYDPVLFGASMLIAMGASIVALYLAFTLRARTNIAGVLLRMLSALVMGLAITGMHYTGMAAANYEPGSVCMAANTINLANVTLAYVIALVVACLLTSTLIASIFDARMASNTMKMLRQVEQANQELEREINERRRIGEALQQQRVELERSNQELQQFAYVASHDLQAPLRGISGFAQMLQRYQQGAVMDKDASEFIQFIVEGAQSMQRLIQALLEFSRTGRGGANRELVSLQPSIETALAHLKSTLDERGAEVKYGPMPTLFVDPTLMSTVMQNLIENATKFQSDKPAIVRISARQESTAWVISVSDNGIGIDPAHYERIFQIFQRLHTNDQYPGSGMGLAMCEKIVRLHEGRIWVESEPGKGSTFSFSIPDTGKASMVA